MRKEKYSCFVSSCKFGHLCHRVDFKTKRTKIVFFVFFLIRFRTTFQIIFRFSYNKFLHNLLACTIQLKKTLKIDNKWVGLKKNVAFLAKGRQDGKCKEVNKSRSITLGPQSSNAIMFFSVLKVLSGYASNQRIS